MGKTRYELFEARNGRWITSFVSVTLDTPNPDTDDYKWIIVKEELNRIPNPFPWVRGVYDLEIVDKMWLVDTCGRMTHFLRYYPLDNNFKKGTCPKCGDEGSFVRMALACPAHGVFGGC